ncbi:MAG: hypothetical protein L3J45_08015 [Flavobacteriaceae bacterium]|nr:hypothetical protein [Flavobacteriaceae bacterium]
MGTKIINLLILALLLLSCDPKSSNKSFFIKNLTTKNLNVRLYQQENDNNLDLPQNSIITILEFSALGGDFGAISDFDSIMLSDTNKNIKWIKPDNIYGYIDTDNNIGKERDVQKDIYNRKNWTSQINGDDEEWIFTINESDLDLFE